MAGVKGRSGGARPGAGRKPAPPVLLEASEPDPIAFLEGIVSDPSIDAKLRVDAAKALLPYKHAKIGEQGKKAARQEAAESVTKGGRFAATPPPTQLRRVQ